MGLLWTQRVTSCFSTYTLLVEKVNLFTIGEIADRGEPSPVVSLFLLYVVLLFVVYFLHSCLVN